MVAEPDFGERVRRYYDALGEDEWARLERNVRGRVSLEIHLSIDFERPGEAAVCMGWRA